MKERRVSIFPFVGPKCIKKGPKRVPRRTRIQKRIQKRVQGGLKKRDSKKNLRFYFHSLSPFIKPHRMSIDSSSNHLLIRLVHDHITDTETLNKFRYALRDTPTIQQIIGPPMKLYRPVPLFHHHMMTWGDSITPTERDLNLRKIACSLHRGQYKRNMDIEHVRKLLGWGQSSEKDAALTVASSLNRSIALRSCLSAEWLDDNDVGWLLIVVHPYHVLDLSDRLRNNTRTAHLMLQYHRALGSCGPTIRKNKRIWLSALACQSVESGVRYSRHIDSEIIKDPAINMALYIRCNTYQKRRVDYDEESSIETLDLYLQDIELELQPYEAKKLKQQQSVDDLDNWQGNATYGRSMQRIWRNNKLETLKLMKPLQDEHQIVQTLLQTKIEDAERRNRSKKGKRCTRIIAN